MTLRLLREIFVAIGMLKMKAMRKGPWWMSLSRMEDCCGASRAISPGH